MTLDFFGLANPTTRDEQWGFSQRLKSNKKIKYENR